jgi:hypothetical protein
MLYRDPSSAARNGAWRADVADDILRSSLKACSKSGVRKHDRDRLAVGSSHLLCEDDA